MFPELSDEEGGSTGLLLRSAPDSELEELDHVSRLGRERGPCYM